MEKPESCYPAECKELGKPSQFAQQESRYVCKCRKDEIDWLSLTNWIEVDQEEGDYQELRWYAWLSTNPPKTKTGFRSGFLAWQPEYSKPYDIEVEGEIVEVCTNPYNDLYSEICDDEGGCPKVARLKKHPAQLHSSPLIDELVKEVKQDKKCSTHCDWPNCTLEGCINKKEPESQYDLWREVAGRVLGYWNENDVNERERLRKELHNSIHLTRK